MLETQRIRQAIDIRSFLNLRDEVVEDQEGDIF